MKTVSMSEASRSVIEEHSKDRKEWLEELRMTAGSWTRKAVPPPEIFADFEEEVVRGKLWRE